MAVVAMAMPSSTEIATTAANMDIRQWIAGLLVVQTARARRLRKGWQGRKWQQARVPRSRLQRTLYHRSTLLYGYDRIPVLRSSRLLPLPQDHCGNYRLLNDHGLYCADLSLRNGNLIKRPARGCLSTPQTGNMLARPGPPLGRIGTYEQHQARS